MSGLSIVCTTVTNKNKYTIAKYLNNYITRMGLFNTFISIDFVYIVGITASCKLHIIYNIINKYITVL